MAIPSPESRSYCTLETQLCSTTRRNFASPSASYYHPSPPTPSATASNRLADIVLANSQSAFFPLPATLGREMPLTNGIFSPSSTPMPRVPPLDYYSTVINNKLFRGCRGLSSFPALFWMGFSMKHARTFI